jgi:hypothetical protein
MFDKLFGCNSIVCNFDKIPTTGTILYQIFVILFVVGSIALLSKYKKNILAHFLVAAIATFIYDFFTAPLKFNLHLGQWGYVYHSVSWVFPLGFAVMVLTTVVLVDKFTPKIKELYRYLISVGILWIVSIIIEKAVVTPLGIRAFAPETIAAFKSETIPFLWNTPILELLYLPVFLALVVAFYKYFSYVVDKKPLVPLNKNKHIRNFAITAVGIILFELTVGSMVNNVNFPSWSYVFHDITFILTGFWIVLVWFATMIIDKYFIHEGPVERFVPYLGVIAVVNIPVEAWLINNGFRVYGPTAVANFTGYTVPLLNVPVEVVFAVPFYFALVLGFVKYISATLDNKE